MKRIYHTWDKWECYPAGFYEGHPPQGMKSEDAENLYASFLRDIMAFESALNTVVSTWKNSCEHYLSNENMNRIAWLGQASMCVAHKVPACFRGGYNKLSDAEKQAADATALKWLNVWLAARGEPIIETVEQAASKTEANLY